MYQIHGIFLSMFTPSEFALWMALREPLGSALLADMPSPTQGGASQYFADVIRALHARGAFESQQFYYDLLRARPRRAAAIATIAGLFGQEESVAVAEAFARHQQRGPPRPVAEASPVEEPVPASFIDDLVVGVKTLLATLFVGGTLILAAHGVRELLARDEVVSQGRVAGDQQVGATSAVPVDVVAPKVSPALVVEPPRGKARRRKPAQVEVMPPAAPAQSIPAPPKRLAVQAVETTLRDVIRDGLHRDLSLSMVVLPDGTVDAKRLVTSSVYGDLAEDIAALRFPPTQAGSGEVLCVVVAELDPATTRLDDSARSVKCRPREAG